MWGRACRAESLHVPQFRDHIRLSDVLGDDIPFILVTLYLEDFDGRVGCVRVLGPHATVTSFSHVELKAAKIEVECSIREVDDLDDE